MKRPATVHSTASVLSALPAREQAHEARKRWLFSLLYLCGLRISEVVSNTMGGFFCRVDKTGEPRWWLEITGEGGKTRLVPVTNELMVELARYRRSLGLSPRRRSMNRRHSSSRCGGARQRIPVARSSGRNR